MAFCIFLLFTEAHLSHVASTAPERIIHGGWRHCLLLWLAQTNPWTMLCLVYPTLFYLGKDARKRQLGKWVQQGIKVRMA